VGRRSRQRGRVAKLTAPTTDYADAEGNVLTLRGSLSARTRREYAATLAGSPTNAFGVGAAREDAWHRAAELLFERLAVRWVIADVPTEGQRELLLRYRAATHDERRWIRDVLRRHVAENFPDVQAP
jgi:hypothetical protein